MQEDQLKSIITKTYARADTYISYILYGFLTLGLGIAAVNGTWIAAICTGGIILITYHASKFFLRMGTVHVVIICLCFGLLGTQLVHQANGRTELHVLFFIILTGLTIFESKRVYLPLLLSIITYHVSSIYLKETAYSFQFLPENSLDFDFLFIYYGTLILGLFFCGWISGFLRSRTIKYYAKKQEYDVLNYSYVKNIEFANEIASGNLEAIYTNAEDDILGKSLREMRDKLNASSEEVKIRNWAAEGIAKIEEILRLNNNSLENLSYAVISHLVKYLGANQGAIFIMNAENENEKYLELKGCYAYEKKKFIEKKIMKGQGLIGQAVVEKEVIHLTEIPQEYIQITSGLGEATPNSIVIVPLKMEDEVIGAIEIATFYKFSNFQIDFLKNVAESIASAVLNSKNNQRTSILLGESRQLAEMLRSQEEEMRQSMEELQAT
ncbi:MAG: GAF domain-containing protein, partial [Bacteroidota bacterium]|nr:GAF domain-containing protein [Bacteroidota bacterium]